MEPNTLLSEADIANLTVTLEDRKEQGASKNTTIPPFFDSQELIKEWLSTDLPVKERTEDGEIRNIEVISPQTIQELLRKLPILTDHCRTAIGKRQSMGISAACPLGAALFNFAKEEKESLWQWDSEKWIAYITDRILNQQKTTDEFCYFLQHYTRTQTRSGRYEEIARFLKKEWDDRQDGKKIMDVGSSAGIALEPLFEIPNLEVIALDKIHKSLNPLLGASLQLASKIQNTPSILEDDIDESKMPIIEEGVTFVSGDALELPFGSEEFDALIYSFILYHLNKPAAQAALREARRVLKVGGLIFIQPIYADEDKRLTTMVIRKEANGLVFHAKLPTNFNTWLKPND